ncbi:type II toxin-antitoxin system VapC family toxin [Rhodopila sp.]|uniref:type II toxin-antitoxin system VapC family toxin n=1 Tax=Rhodopila sp. TaxID=2480087 RepID=UPI003D1284B1
MFIADACALLAYFGGGGRTMGRAGMDAMRADVVVSPITVWELTRKAATGKLPPLPSESGSFARHLVALGLREIPLSLGDAEAANALPPHHRDQMDRMLIATALRTGLTVITNDAVFPAYGVTTVW